MYISQAIQIHHLLAVNKLHGVGDGLDEEYALCCQVVLYTKSELNFHTLYILDLNTHLLLIIALYMTLTER